MSKVTVDAKWYRFRQNNSGGYHVIDDQVAEEVFIQAIDERQAKSKAAEICGPSSIDWCPCCGERWSFYIDEDDVGDVPTLYGEPITKATGYVAGKGVRLHYLDGRVESTEVRGCAK